MHFVLARNREMSLLTCTSGDVLMQLILADMHPEVRRPALLDPLHCMQWSLSTELVSTEVNTVNVDAHCNIVKTSQNLSAPSKNHTAHIYVFEQQ